MSAFSGTFLDFAMRDLGLLSFAIVGIVTEVGIEPTVRPRADLGYVPVVVADACGVGHAGAGERAMEIMEFAGDAVITDAQTIGSLFRRARPER